jgi:hypothetical protein
MTKVSPGGVRAAVAAGFVAAVLATTASAQDAATFCKDRNIAVVVASPPVTAP